MQAKKNFSAKRALSLPTCDKRPAAMQHAKTRAALTKAGFIVSPGQLASGRIVATFITQERRQCSQ